LTVSVQTSHSAYLRTQASFLAQSMIDRMRANTIGIWNGNYAGTYTGGSGGSQTGCLNTASCSAAAIAARDVAIWSNQLGDFLPKATGSITCTAPAITPTANQIAAKPPFQGACTITISWSESNLTRAGTPPTESFAWVFQP
jgi:type IV pilus assembly protein PilV